jgi:hypothetical protein
VPLASYRESFDVYRIETFPVPMSMDRENGVHGYTILKARFPYIAVMKDRSRYKELTSHEYQLCSQVYDPVCPALAITYPSHRRSCLFAVFLGEEKMINSECDFRVQTDRVAPTLVAKLTKNKHLLINVPSPVRIQCGSGSEYVEIGNYTEVTLACGCRFNDNSITGEIEISSCSDAETSLGRETSVKYPIGYAAMKLFEATNNITFKENLLSEMAKKDTEPELAMPRLQDMSYELAKMTGRDRSLGFSMKELVKEADKRKTTFTPDTSPDVMVGTSDLVSWVVFGVMIAWNVGLTLWVMADSKQLKIMKLTIATLMAEVIPGAHAFVIPTEFPDADIVPVEKGLSIWFVLQTTGTYMVGCVALAIFVFRMIQIADALRYKVKWYYRYMPWCCTPPKHNQEMEIFLKMTSGTESEIIYIQTVPYDQLETTIEQVPEIYHVLVDRKGCMPYFRLHVRKPFLLNSVCGQEKIHPAKDSIITWKQYRILDEMIMARISSAIKFTFLVKDRYGTVYVALPTRIEPGSEFFFPSRMTPQREIPGMGIPGHVMKNMQATAPSISAVLNNNLTKGAFGEIITV